MLMGLDVQWEQVSIHDQGRIQAVWGQRDTGVSILRGMIIAEGGSENLIQEQGWGGVCVWIISLILKPAVSLAVTCWEYNQFPSQGLCVLKARMRGTVELCQYFSAGAVLLSRGRFGNSWECFMLFHCLPGRFQLCQTFCSFRTVLPNKELRGVLHVFRMTQWAFLKDVI